MCSIFPAWQRTVSALLEMVPPGGTLPTGRDMGPIEALDLRPAWDESGSGVLLAPIDLHCVKASGVTFAVSALERVIEERARGDSAGAAQFRAEIQAKIGGDIQSVRPGSPEAMNLKEMLIASGAWSQYLEVAIGPDAEIFTKAPVLSGGRIGRLGRHPQRFALEQPRARSGDRRRFRRQCARRHAG